jgi:hypothetical protein
MPGKEAWHIASAIKDRLRKSRKTPTNPQTDPSKAQPKITSREL